MMDLAALKKDRDLTASIDWEITPRQAFEAYQLKSKDNWRYSSLSEVCYFVLSTWKGNAKLILMKRDYVESEELAEIDAPAELIQAQVKRAEGEDMPRGQLPIGEDLTAWLQKELGV